MAAGEAVGETMQKWGMLINRYSWSLILFYCFNLLLATQSHIYRLGGYVGKGKRKERKGPQWNVHGEDEPQPTTSSPPRSPF